MTQMVHAEDNIVLRVEGLSKTFPGTKALDDVSFQVCRGEIRALVGGNGSGKSTLIKILAGVQPADPGGRIVIGGAELEGDQITPELSHSSGLRFVHQNPAMFPALTVAENIAIGKAGFPTRFGRIRWRELRDHTRELLERFEIRVSPDTVIGELRPADQTMVAVARALQDDGPEGDRISALILDEPTASLPAHEVSLLVAAIRRCAEAGHTVIFVSHRIDEVMALCSHATILRDGHLVLERETAGLSEEELVRAIVGRPLDRAYPGPAGKTKSAENPMLEVSELRGGPLESVSFVARRGEIVGIAGLLGSGRTELLRMIFGAYPKTGGKIRLDGSAVAIPTPSAAIGLGIAYVPEDRERDAAYLGQTVKQNILATRPDRFWRGWRFVSELEDEIVDRSIQDLGIKTTGADAVFASLSGGNQQKAILSRWLSWNPGLLLLDEPTQGVDVGARADVHRSVKTAAAGGAAVLLVSSDFEELVHSTDRILVLRQGRICAELASSDTDAESIAELAYSKRKQVA